MWLRRRRARAIADELVRRALLPLADIPFEISSALDDELDDDVLRDIVAAAWAAQRAESTADHVTPLDRLAAAFAALEGGGVMARHYPTAGRSEAYDLIQRELATAARTKCPVDGFCFYDQIGARKMAQRGLTFCFGCAESPPTYAQLWTRQLAVAQHVVEALTRHGFVVDWNGEASSVIAIGDVTWTGRRTADGAPAIKLGPQLDIEKAPPRVAPAAVTNVFVACANNADLAHRFIAGVADLKARPAFGDVARFAIASSAVDYTSADGRLFDLVAAPADARLFGSRRDMANEAHVLLVLADGVAEAETSPWWSLFPPAARLTAALTTDPLQVLATLEAASRR